MQTLRLPSAAAAPDAPRKVPASISRVNLVPPPCSIGITVGSERGTYVPQQHVFQSVGRPHHLVNLMFQYYPDMPQWPTQGVNCHGFFRNRQLNSGDGYFPLSLDPDGPWGQEFLREIADVRAHGAEPQLTLTLHADTPDAILIRIAESRRPFTPMRIRINHECNGTWFHFNERWSYQQVAHLFVRFHRILHDHAPGVSTVACWNGNAENLRLPADQQPLRGRLTEDELAPAFRSADIISIDQYASLHYGWPDPAFNPAAPSQYFRVDFDDWWTEIENVRVAISRIRNEETDIEIHEVNDDADVVGEPGQAAWIRRFYREACDRAHPWLKNITFYQFRDRGGLGLEREDVADPNRYEVLPSFKAYREAIADRRFGLLSQCAHGTEQVPYDAQLSWSGPAEATGLRMDFGCMPKAPHHLLLPRSQRLMVREGEQWRIKPSGADRLCLAPAARDVPLIVDVFALPEDGRNNRSHAFAARLAGMPRIEPC